MTSLQVAHKCQLDVIIISSGSICKFLLGFMHIFLCGYHFESQSNRRFQYCSCQQPESFEGGAGPQEVWLSGSGQNKWIVDIHHPPPPPPPDNTPFFCLFFDVVWGKKWTRVFFVGFFFFFPSDFGAGTVGYRPAWSKLSRHAWHSSGFNITPIQDFFLETPQWEHCGIEEFEKWPLKWP